MAAPNNDQRRKNLVNNLVVGVAIFGAISFLKRDKPIHATDGQVMANQLKVYADRNSLAQVHMETLALTIGQAFKKPVIQVNQPFRPTRMRSDYGVIVMAFWINVVRHAADATATECTIVFDVIAVGSSKKHVGFVVVLGLGDVEGLHGRIIVVGQDSHGSSLSLSMAASMACSTWRTSSQGSDK